ncbi:sphingosine 1-phosphate receptor 4 [Ctenopharyngodon idella]|uniref:sphingosine 1-phosphate receptor 4 n=1 Tax=Ctenopharyngodon idella TaxID=7959 RepID=UPI002230869D|nr:sphingosine 1-phosphate receptor 4 [Ctenopharyngodon idella]
MEVLRSFSSASSCPDMYNWTSNSLILGHYNFTGRLQHRKPSKSGISAVTILFLCFSVFIILENLMVLLAVLFRVRMRHRWIFICIANIALSDLLTGSAYVVNIYMSGERTFKLSPVLWLFREGLLFVALAASIFSLLLIAVERYATMMKPVHQKTATKTYRIYIMVGLCWITALIIGFLPLMGWNCVCDLRSCSTLLPLYSKSYILFALVIFFIILLTIGALYFAIYCHVRSSTEATSVRKCKRSLRLLKAVISIVGVFMVCWGPLFILLLVDFFCYSRNCSTLFNPEWVIALAVLNSAMNPLIYSFGSLELRKAIASLLCCCCLKAGLCDPKTFMSKETSSTSGSRHSSLRNSFSKVRNLSTSPPPELRNGKKTRLSSTTSCLSASSG